MTEVKEKRKLTVKQEAFCVNYFLKKNATQAAIAAGYSKNSAGVIGEENLRKPEIQERLKELNDAAVIPAEVAVASVIERKQLLTAIARHNIEKPVTAGHVIAAAKELNLMEHVYEDRGTGNEIVNNFLFVLPDGRKLTPGELTTPLEIPQDTDITPE